MEVRLDDEVASDGPKLLSVATEMAGDSDATSDQERERECVCVCVCVRTRDENRQKKTGRDRLK